ncbi:MAG: hypothetical protein ACFFCO_12830, partial [Promethearchaeota archaeon]
AADLRSRINSIISGDYNSETDQSGDNDSSADQPGWPVTTIIIIIGVIIFLSIIGLIAAGNLLGWSSPKKKRSKGRTKRTHTPGLPALTTGKTLHTYEYS